MTITSTASTSAPSLASTRTAHSTWANGCACGWTASIHQATSWNSLWQLTANSRLPTGLLAVSCRLSAFFIQPGGNQRRQDRAHPEVEHPSKRDAAAEGCPGRHREAEGETHCEAYQQSHAQCGDGPRPEGGTRGRIHPGQNVGQEEQRHEPVDHEERVTRLG